MIEKVYGNTLTVGLLKDAIDKLESDGADGTIYLGYPVLSTVESNVVFECLFVSKKYGLVILSTSGANDEEIGKAQDQLFFALQTHLGKFGDLRKKRELAVPINVVTIVGDSNAQTKEPLTTVPLQILNSLPDVEELPDSLMRKLNSALQCIVTLRPRKSRSNVSERSKGAILKQIETQIANLDKWQKIAALESPDGPQRVRGLAGTGKTVVLALKAAYLHARYPDWKIGITFYTRSLYQQFQDLINRFFREHSALDPDFEQLEIVHAWGSSWTSGVYNRLATHLGHPVRDFAYAKNTYGYDDAFRGIITELLRFAESKKFDPIYDAFLIDEAQDLPPEFFRLIYMFVKPPKRIVWAYDELQNLSNADGLPPVESLFGQTPNGNPLVSLSNEDGEPRRDIVLPVCYRNTPWTLSSAHALGFGIYRDGPLVQYFDDPQLWNEIGYEAVQGDVEPGNEVTLARRTDATPAFFRELLDEEDAVIFHNATSKVAQYEWVAASIFKDVTTEDIDPDDVMIIFPTAISAKTPSAELQRVLSKYEIRSHIVGTNSSSSEMFVKGSVSISHVFRAKGNETPVVYVVNAQECEAKYNQALMRNALFTAMTRSRAWLRVVGYGPGMEKLSQEFKLVKEHDYQLKFKVPTEVELQQIRRIHRDLSPEEKKRRTQQRNQLEKILKALREDGITIGELDADLAEQLRAMLGNAKK